MKGASTTAIRRVPLLGLMKLDATEADLDAALRAIENNDPPLAIRQYFRKFQHAVEFYAKVRAFQFSVPNRPTICCDCQTAEGEIVAELCWTSVFSRFSAWTFLTILTAAVGHLHVFVKRYTISFSSYHGFCPGCWGRYRRYRCIKGVLEATTLLMILGGAAFATGFGLAPTFDDRLASHAKLLLYLESAGCAAIAIAGMVIRVLCRQFGVPSQILFIAPRPFQLARTYVMKAITLPGSEPKMIFVPKYRPVNPSAMSWQQTVGVLITLFGLIPGVAMAFGNRISAPYRVYGYETIGAWIVLVVILTVWHQMRQKKIRSTYYMAMAQQLARVGSERTGDQLRC